MNYVLGWREYKQPKLQVPMQNLYSLIKRESADTTKFTQVQESVYFLDRAKWNLRPHL